MALLVRIQLTPKQHEVIWHRLGCGLIAECLSDDPDTTVAEAEAARERLEAVDQSLQQRFESKTFIDVATEDEAAVLIEAFEGSTYWADIDHEEPAQRGAEQRCCDSLLAKLTEAFPGRRIHKPCDM